MQWIVQLVFLLLIRWIAIYLVDSAIQLLNNQGQLDKAFEQLGPGLDGLFSVSALASQHIFR